MIHHQKSCFHQNMSQDSKDDHEKSLKLIQEKKHNNDMGTALRAYLKIVNKVYSSVRVISKVTININHG